ncbi:MAG: hypothetical protein QG567_1185 [Campylobacterota bacterium]|nr:hypothetical protein [Campylobacterota bacterium]
MQKNNFMFSIAKPSLELVSNQDDCAKMMI